MTVDSAARTAGHKADFSRIYNQPDPRAYFAALAPLQYQVPQLAKPVIAAAVAASGARTVLDVCCSYGINSALLRCDLELADLQEHAAAADGRCAEAVRVADADFYARHLTRPELDVVGLDVAPAAIDYARRTGLMRDGWAENLESDDPSPQLAAALREVGLIVCTGGVGYVGAATFERIVAANTAPEDLWGVLVVLRVFDATEIVKVFEQVGLVTERLLGPTFPQRRFVDAAEQAAAIADVRRRGLDPAGKEAAGWFHADCLIVRPGAAAEQTPIRDLVPARGVV